MTELEVVEEDELAAGRRRALAELLGAVLEEGARYAGRGWRTLPPAFRVVAVDPAGRPVGQVSAFAIATDPPVRLFGLGDLGVHAASRGRGVARALSRTVVEECWRREADVALCKTRPMRSVLGEMGFVPVERFACYWEDERCCHRHPDWMAAWRGCVPERLWLAHGDF